MRIIKLSEEFTPRHEGIFFGLDTENEMPADVTIEVVDMASEEVLAQLQNRHPI